MNTENKWRIDHILESNIRNYVRNLIHEAMEAGFSVQELKQALTNDLQGVRGRSKYKDKIRYFLKDGFKYCVKMLGEPIGDGSSRSVFQIDDTRVLKLATNMKGIAQNKAEVMVYNQATDKTFMPIIYNDSDMENYFYVISEYVLPANEEDFEHIFEVPFSVLVSIVSSQKRGKKIKAYEQHLPKVRGLLQYFTAMSKIGVNINDWFYIDNWGLTKRNGKETLVTLDNGFTQNVVRNFYRNNDNVNDNNEFLDMMGPVENNQQDRRQPFNKFREVLPMYTIGRNIVAWAKTHSTDYYKSLIEEFRKSDFQNKDVISKLLYGYINEKYPEFDWGDNVDHILPQYAYDRIVEQIKKMYSNINK